jgi:hypothetical protein
MMRRRRRRRRIQREVVGGKREYSYVLRTPPSHRGTKN